jgi:phosphate transport system substrate-binding protein
MYLKSQPTGETKVFIDWILSAEGQKMVEKVGYYPLN